MFLQSMKVNQLCPALAFYLVQAPEGTTQLSSSETAGARRPQLLPPAPGTGQPLQKGQAAAHCRQEGKEQDERSTALPLNPPKEPQGRCRALSHARDCAQAITASLG